MPVLQATQLSCEKQDRTLFQSINLSIESGELVLLKGENGAGKTSLLRILVGLSQPQAGSVLINNYCVLNEIDYAAPEFIYCGHKLGNNNLLTATENLVFWCQLQGMPADKEKIANVLLELGLAGLEDIPAKNLSAGQQRRVSLARLWLKPEAKLWVLDEPFTALDVNTVKQIEEKIEYFLDRQGAVIMTSHQLVSVNRPSRVFELEYAW